MTMALLTLARPRMLPLVWLAVFFGFMLGHWEAGIHFQGGFDLLATLGSWTLLHLGTMWLNAARDQDAGPIAFGQAADVPETTQRIAFVALATTVVAAALAGPVVTASATTLVVLSILYSHPATAWKGHPIGGPFVNIVGYGLLTPLAGLTAARGGVGLRTAVVLSLTALSIAGLYFAAQAFQEDEDRARGDRTLVATHGPRAVLRTARTCLALAYCGALLGMIWGWFPRGCLLATPFAIRVDAHMKRWSTRPGGGSPEDARVLVRRMIQLLGALVFTAVTQHIYDMLQGELPAGLNTRIVPRPWFTLR